MFKFNVMSLLVVILSTGYTTHSIATDSGNTKVVEKTMLMEEHMKKMDVAQPDVKTEISKKLYQLNQQAQCPKLTADDIKIAMEKKGISMINSMDEDLIIENSQRQFSLKFTSAMAIPGSNISVVMTEMLSELSPGKYTCKYELRTPDGGLGGGFELALKK